MTAVVAQPRKDWTILEVLQWTSARFAERGIDSPRLDAELLVAHALGCKRLELYLRFDKLLTPDELAAVRELIKRRQGGESVAYITGRKEFWSLDLAVDARVLVPRPDTETAVEEALERLPPAGAPARALDVGTGSGAIALALAKTRPGLEVFASDASPDSLVVARDNAARLGLNVTFLEGDLLAPAREHAPFALIVANLPYIPSGDIPGLSPEVRSEPMRALDGGSDGLDLVRRLVAGAPALLAPDGGLVLEIGIGQAREVSEICRAAGLVDVRVRRDLGGVDRVVSARKQAEGAS